MTVGWLALTQTVLFYGATFWGIAHAGAGLSAVLANTDPLFVAILAGAVLGERLGGAQWAGLVVGLAGATCVVWEGPLWPPEVSAAGLVVVGGALAWSVGTVVAARSMRARARPARARRLADGRRRGGPRAGRARSCARTPRPPAAREAGLVLALAVVGSAAPLALFYTALGAGAGRRGLGLVLPDPGDRGAERVAVARRDARAAAAGRAWWGCRSGSGWCSAATARGRGGW